MDGTTFVDRAAYETFANAIEEYVDEMQSKIQNALRALGGLQGEWSDDDLKDLGMTVREFAIAFSGVGDIALSLTRRAKSRMEKIDQKNAFVIDRDGY